MRRERARLHLSVYLVTKNIEELLITVHKSQYLLLVAGV